MKLARVCIVRFFGTLIVSSVFALLMGLFTQWNGEVMMFTFYLAMLFFLNAFFHPDEILCDLYSQKLRKNKEGAFN